MKQIFKLQKTLCTFFGISLLILPFMLSGMTEENLIIYTAISKKPLQETNPETNNEIETLPQSWTVPQISKSNSSGSKTPSGRSSGSSVSLSPEISEVFVSIANQNGNIQPIEPVDTLYPLEGNPYSKSLQNIHLRAPQTR